MKIFGSIFLMLVGGGMGIHAHSEWTIAHSASEKPEQILLKDLIGRGPVGNPHVVVTDFVLCSNFVYQQANPNAPWTKVWVPIIPVDEVPDDPGELLQPTSPKAILVSTQARSPLDLKNHARKMQALVTNSVESSKPTEPKVRDLLQRTYPGIDFNQCLFIEEGRRPLSADRVYLIAGSSVVCFTLGLLVLLFSFIAQIRSERTARPDGGNLSDSAM